MRFATTTAVSFAAGLNYAKADKDAVAPVNPTNNVNPTTDNTPTTDIDPQVMDTIRQRMADQFANFGPTMTFVRLSDIANHPLQMRDDSDDANIGSAKKGRDNLLASFKRKGFDYSMPITVMSEDEKPTFETVNGRRVLKGNGVKLRGHLRSDAAVRLINENPEAGSIIFPDGLIPAIVHPKLSEQAQVEIVNDHSAVSQKLTAVENLRNAYNLHTLFHKNGRKLPQTQIAAMVSGGRLTSQTIGANCAILDKVDAEVREATLKGKISMLQCRKIFEAGVNATGRRGECSVGTTYPQEYIDKKREILNGETPAENPALTQKEREIFLSNICKRLPFLKDVLIVLKEGVRTHTAADGKVTDYVQIQDDAIEAVGEALKASPKTRGLMADASHAIDEAERAASENDKAK